MAVKRERSHSECNLGNCSSITPFSLPFFSDATITLAVFLAAVLAAVVGAIWRWLRGRSAVPRSGGRDLELGALGGAEERARQQQQQQQHPSPLLHQRQYNTTVSYKSHMLMNLMWKRYWIMSPCHLQHSESVFNNLFTPANVRILSPIMQPVAFFTGCVERERSHSEAHFRHLFPPANCSISHRSW